jgi:imidazole glycerol-phosphate synthase subunit HisF
LIQRIRVIPVLSLINGQLVKTINFKKPNYLGDPINAIKIFNEKEVDELVVLDIRASLHKTEPDYDLIKEMAGECFMPLAYGGNIYSINVAHRIFELGVEKIILNSALHNNIKLAKEISLTYGEQSVVASVDVRNSLFGKKKLYFKSGSKKNKLNILEYCNQLEENGVGEIIINNIDNEGTFNGYDIELISEISQNVSIPVIALGGASNVEDFLNVIKEGYASAVAASSMFVYKNNNPESILINYPNQTDLKSKLYNKLYDE